nr:MAG TPA: hypothetical protein [Caudoviricetes sp.]
MTFSFIFRVLITIVLGAFVVLWLLLKAVQYLFIFLPKLLSFICSIVSWTCKAISIPILSLATLSGIGWILSKRGVL